MSSYNCPQVDKDQIKLLQKYLRGDGVTNEELDKLIKFYHDALNAIQHLNFADRAFHHAFCEIQSHYLTLNDYKNARKRHGW